MQIRPRDWFDFDDAPKDGTPILACRDNGCGWEHEVMWWGGGRMYPWQSANNAYPDDRFDYFQYLTAPHNAAF